MCICPRRIEGEIPRQRANALFFFLANFRRVPRRIPVEVCSGWWKQRTEPRRKRSLKEKRKRLEVKRRREKELRRQTDSSDSVRFELAGFGEYGSFVVRRGPRGSSLFSIPPSPLLSLSRAIRSGEPSRTERTSYLPVLPDGCCVSAAGETEWKRAGGDEKDEEIERMYRRTDLLSVTRVCVNSSFVSLPCPPVYKRPGGGDDVLPSVTVHHLSSILPASLVLLSLPSATEDDTAAVAVAAPGKWANKGGTGGRLVALAPDFGMRLRASEEYGNSC